MEIREETLDIFKNSFGVDAAYRVMEYIDSKVRDDVATQKDVFEIKLEIEKVRAEIEKVRADLQTEIEKIRGDVKTVEANLRIDIEKIRADLSKDIEKNRSDLLKWSFAFWISQVALLAGIIFKLLS